MEENRKEFVALLEHATQLLEEEENGYEALIQHVAEMLKDGKAKAWVYFRDDSHLYIGHGNQIEAYRNTCGETGIAELLAKLYEDEEENLVS